MKEIKLKNGYVILVDDADYELVSKYKWTICKNKSGHMYAQTTVKMHRLIMQPDPGLVVDHRDNNGLNNTRDNLEVVSASMNLVRMRKFPRNKTGYRGVSKNYGKYTADIAKEGKTYRLGTFETAKEAGAAYDRASVELFGKDGPKSKLDGWAAPERITTEDLRRTLAKAGVL